MNIRRLYLSVLAVLLVSTVGLFATGVNQVGQYFGSPGFNGSSHVVSTENYTEYVDLYIHSKTSGWANDSSYYWYTQEITAYDDINVADWYFYWCTDIVNEVCYEHVDSVP